MSESLVSLCFGCRGRNVDRVEMQLCIVFISSNQLPIDGHRERMVIQPHSLASVVQFTVIFFIFCFIRHNKGTFSS